MQLDLRTWQTRLFVAGSAMLVLSLLLVASVLERFRFVPVEGHVLEMMMWAFAAGYSFYSGIALPLLGSAFGRLKLQWKSEA